MNIRMTDAIVHVVRCFVDDDIIHVDGNVDPLRDVEVISLELILADLSQIEKRLERVSPTVCSCPESCSVPVFVLQTCYCHRDYSIY